MGYSGNQQYSSVTIGTIIPPLLENLAQLSSNMRIMDDAAKASQQDTLIAPDYNFSIGAPRNFSSRELGPVFS